MIFDAIAFPWLLYSITGKMVTRGDGSLLQLPPQANQPMQLDFYAKIKNTGWTKCPLGYAVYSRTLPENSINIQNILIIPGLKVRGISVVSGKSEGLTIVINPVDLEFHIDTIFGAEMKIRERYDAAARENIHEIRGINTGLYHAAHELLQIVQREVNHYKHPSDLAFNIVALSQTITARLDLISYLTDPQLSKIDVGNVSVFQKFDKIIRSLKPAAQNQKKNIDLSGASFASVHGPKGLMELIAYLLLDNAIKYSPDNELIGVHFRETNERIFVTVTSIGPKIEPDEIDLIFQRDYRSKSAASSGKSGSGIGLYALANLVRGSFGGAVAASCGNFVREIRSTLYHEVTFNIDFPISPR